MDPVLESFLYAEYGLKPEWFPWKVEALGAAGVLSEADCAWWLRRAKELNSAGPPVPDEVRDRAAAMALDPETMIRLHRAGIVTDEQLLEVAEREGPLE